MLEFVLQSLKIVSISILLYICYVIYGTADPDESRVMWYFISGIALLMDIQYTHRIGGNQRTRIKIR